MSTPKIRRGNATPSELVTLAVAMHGQKFTEANGDARRELLADALWAWRLARTAIDSGLQSEREKEEEIHKSLHDSPTDQTPKEPLTLAQAASQLGYKETRGVRSVLELAEAMDRAEPRRFEGLDTGQRTGLAAWIENVGVDETQLDALRKFKAQRTTSGRAAGGRSAARKKPVK